MKTADLWYSRHPSAFLIAAIKARPNPPPPPPPPPPRYPLPGDTGKSCLRRLARPLLARGEVKGLPGEGGGLKAHRIDSAASHTRIQTAVSREQPEQRAGLFRDISDSRTKKEIDSPRRKRASSSYLSSLPAPSPPPSLPLLPPPASLAASLTSRGLLAIDPVLFLFPPSPLRPLPLLSLFLYLSISLSYLSLVLCTYSDDNCTNSFRTYGAIRLGLRYPYGFLRLGAVYDFQSPRYRFSANRWLRAPPPRSWKSRPANG